MKRLIIVALGGALGAVARYGASEVIRALWPSQFPLGTLLVNITGSFVVGLFLTLTGSNSDALVEWKLFIAVGFLGAYTTFSAFEYETLELAKDGRFLSAALNIILSVALGLIAVWVGVAIGRRISP